MNRSAAGDAGNVSWAPESTQQSDDVLRGTTGDDNGDALHAEIDAYLEALQATAVMASGAPAETALGAVLEEAMGARRQPMGGFGSENIMVRLNRPRALLAKLAAHGELRGPGPATFSVEVAADDTGSGGFTLAFERGGGDVYKVSGTDSCERPTFWQGTFPTVLQAAFNSPI